METRLENREIVTVEILAAAAGRSRKDVLAAGRITRIKPARNDAGPLPAGRDVVS